MRGVPPTDFASEYNVKALGSDVTSLIDAFGYKKAIIIGHDWGASAVYQAGVSDILCKRPIQRFPFSVY